mgnify:CR=1 FL=1
MKKDSTSDIKFLLEKQQKELTDSLKYGSFIQKALLPDATLLKRCFKEYFLLYKPCELVSGDFYWVSRKNNLVYFAIADCTGHGVPGAFLSILGLSLLNQLIEKCIDLKASIFLNSLREYIMKALHQTGDIYEQKDGIDMAFCILDYKKHSITYSGAFLPLYIVRNYTQLIEIPADKMPIGIAADEERPFSDHEIALQEGDMIYLFTDGYVDQFGGELGKKFKYIPFRNLLLSVCKFPAEEQQKKIEEAHISWKGDISQLDDISVFGFRYKRDE